MWLILAASALAQSKPQTVHLEKPWAAGQWKSLARLAPSNHLSLALGLPLRNQGALAGLLRDLYDPASLSYHKYLTPAQFAERFAPSEQDYLDTIRFAVSHGLSVTGAHASRALLDVSGTIPDIEKAFHVRMGVYQHPTEKRTFYAPDTDPSLDLSVPLAAVVGLDNFILPRPMDLKAAFDATNATAYVSGSGPEALFLGRDFRNAYALGVTLTGTGQSVGLFELDGYYSSDIAEYENLAKLSPVALTNVLLDGFSGAPGQNQVEVTLDIDMAICMAPGLSQVIVYEGSTPDGVLDRMATDNLAAQLSCSWGFGPAVDPAREQIYEQFAAQGQTMFQASGDGGAYLGSIISPSDDPNVTVVGGTALTTAGAGGPWSAETTWPGSGGGVSTLFPLPYWQDGLSTPANQASTKFRNIPDVAIQGQGGSVWLFALDGQGGVGGGTSAAAPLWAGFAALANQQAAARSLPRIGFINPALYAIGRSASYGGAFHDITTGNNTNNAQANGFFAAPGYDLCTGWGSPAGINLINALLSPPDALQIFPPGNLAASGLAGGPFTPASQNVILTNIGGAPADWAAGTVPWLDVTPPSGMLVSNGPAALVSLAVNTNANAFPPGTYTAAVWFTNLNDGIAQSRTLILDVFTNSAFPVIVSQPANQTAFPGAVAVFTVAAVGKAPLSYQWQKNSANLSDGPGIAGSTSATLTVNNVSADAAGTYSVIVSDSLGSAPSDGAVLTVISVTAPGVTFFNLYSFTGGNDGANPNGLMQETNGNFYGTTQNGGASGLGAVFEMTPSGGETTLFSFTTDGGGGFAPAATLTQGANGILYGAAESGGPSGWGTLFQITTNGSASTIYNFNGGNGGFPNSTMILAADGNFYGTTVGGGIDQDGEIFRLSPAGALVQLVPFDFDNGYNPNKLLQGADGSFYGTTFNGGTNANGTIFNMTPGGILTTVFTFSHLNGGYLPEAGLAQDANGTLYGTTYEGGSSGFGTIFAMLPSPSFAMRTYYSFTGGTDGGHPSAELIQAADGNFYGTTAYGGANGDGTVFRLAPGGAPVTIVSFDGFNGANPQAPLVQGTDGNLYGTTPNGGADGDGVIFRLSLNAPNVQITGQPAAQKVFLGSTAIFSVAATGNPPLFYQWRENKTNLVDGGSLSGSTTRVLTISNVSLSSQGAYSATISNLAGSTAVSAGASLEAIQSAPQILVPPSPQTASVGGTAIFQVFADGDLPLTYQWQSNQINLSNGPGVSGAASSLLTLAGLKQISNAVISVIASNALGTAAASTTLRVNPPSLAGTAAASLYAFTGGPDGGAPNGLALGTNGLLYGTTQAGGAGGGVVFSIASNGVFRTLAIFNLTNGSNPQAALALGADGNFYGTAQNGGVGNGGTVFELSPAGDLATLCFFTNQNNLNPYTALAQGPNGNFYGASKNALKSGAGNIFEVGTNGALSVVYSFTGGLDGNEPIGALALASDGNFYGMTTAGGAHSFGGVFRMTPGGALTNIYSFTGGTDGFNPDGALMQATDGSLYGTTRRNSKQGFTFYGTIFKISTAGALTTLYTLNPNVFGDGAFPFTGLIQGQDGQFYGDTLDGGGPNNDGAVFSITTAGAYTNLISFDGSDDGANPESALVQDAAGNFYGTTTAGGPLGKGSVFRLTITSAPRVTVQPSNQIAAAGASAQFSVSVFGASPLGFQWLKNSRPLAGAASRVLVINSIDAGDAGTYSVVVTNALGAAASQAATLTVIQPPAFQSAALSNGALVITWSAAPGQSYQVQSTGNLASPNWASVGGVLTATNAALSASVSIGALGQQFYRVVLLP
ncbi:MAG TPA: choice-of-anchor tandem repeat GloVer-containing protein [Verrucomicrobiae bacterium]